MKLATLLTYPTATLCLVLTASAEPHSLRSLLKSLRVVHDQAPLYDRPNVVMPPKSAGSPEEEISTGIIISDVIGKTQSIAIFSGLTRDIDTVSDRLDDASKNATVLAPDNGVMRNLKRKPWEDPKDYEQFGANAYNGGNGEDRAHKNLRRFVESHIIPQSPWKEGEKVKTISGTEIWYETKEGKKIIQPTGVEVSSIADKVANGEVWIINGVLI